MTIANKISEVIIEIVHISSYKDLVSEAYKMNSCVIHFIKKIIEE